MLVPWVKVDEVGAGGLAAEVARVVQVSVGAARVGQVVLTGVMA